MLASSRSESLCMLSLVLALLCQDLGLPVTSPLRVPGIMIVAGEQAMSPPRLVNMEEVD